MTYQYNHNIFSLKSQCIHLDQVLTLFRFDFEYYKLFIISKRTGVVYMNDLKKSIGKRIARLRNDAGLTQLKLSEMINIHENNLSSIERGKFGVSMETNSLMQGFERKC